MAKKISPPKNKINKETNSTDNKNFNKSNIFFISIPFAIALIIWLFIWIVPKGSPVIDPWYKAIQLVDSAANRTQNPKIKQKLFDESGQQLRDLVKKHPYHARVHFFLGYYYFVTQNWDSALIELKEAARIDSGSILNSVWPDAHDLIAKTCINKSVFYTQSGQFNDAKAILLEGYKYAPKQALINRFLGNIYYNLKDYENAMKHLMISFSVNPNDDITANLLGILYNMKGDFNNARAYFNKALQINPNNQSAKVNLNNLNALLK